MSPANTPNGGVRRAQSRSEACGGLSTRSGWVSFTLTGHHVHGQRLPRLSKYEFFT